MNWDDTAAVAMLLREAKRARRSLCENAAKIEQPRRSLRGALVSWFGQVGCIVAALLLMAHGPAEWIQRGGYKNSAGELCCGERDCFELADGDVKITDAGFYIISIKETVPFSEATPSPDGKYWRCQWGGSRKCFFAPPGAV